MYTDTVGLLFFVCVWYVVRTEIVGSLLFCVSCAVHTDTVGLLLFFVFGVLCILIVYYCFLCLVCCAY